MGPSSEGLKALEKRWVEMTEIISGVKNDRSVRKLRLGNVLADIADF